MQKGLKKSPNLSIYVLQVVFQYESGAYIRSQEILVFKAEPSSVYGLSSRSNSLSFLFSAAQMKILRRNKKPDDDDVNVVLQDIRLNIVSALIHLICDPPCSRGLCCCGVTKAPFAMKQSVLSAGHAFSSVLCLPNCLLFFYIVCCSRKR